MSFDSNDASQGSAVCDRCGVLQFSVQLRDCKHVVTCLRCSPWLSKTQVCQECAQAPSKIISFPSSQRASSLWTFKYLGTLWELEAKSGTTPELLISSTLSLHNDRMTLLVNGQAFKSGHFLQGFEAAKVLAKMPTLMAAPEKVHAQVASIENFRAREERNERITGAVTRIYTILTLILETIWLFFASLFRPIPTRTDNLLQVPGQRPHQD